MAVAGTGRALAADAADRAIIGFSADGRYFAFEEFGIQDGSGFAYANIFVLDLEDDKWVEGSPVRVQKREDASQQPLRSTPPGADRGRSADRPVWHHSTGKAARQQCRGRRGD